MVGSPFRPWAAPLLVGAPGLATLLRPAFLALSPPGLLILAVLLLMPRLAFPARMAARRSIAVVALALRTVSRWAIALARTTVATLAATASMAGVAALVMAASLAPDLDQDRLRGHDGPVGTKPVHGRFR